MDYRSAIQSHNSWKKKLTAYLRKPDGTLNPDHLGSDCRCSLGQWIYGRGMQYCDLPEYVQLKFEHARFHQCAGELVKQADLGRDVSQEMVLGAESDFAIFSAAVIRAILKMKKKIDHARYVNAT